ncbi:hypothetical protein N9F16_00365 [bacterium]|nr:hypothetical protein [bacterium]
MPNWKKITTDADLTAISASLTTTDQIISSSVASLSGSASDARNLLDFASDYTSVYVTVDTTAINDRLYVFTSATTVTLTLPASPSNGDSLYIANRSAIATNIVARNGELIMGLAQDMTLNAAQASFKFTYAAGAQGWVITGAGGAGIDTSLSASTAALSSSYTALSESISPLSASLTVTDQIISSSVATLSGSASDARNLIVANISGSSTQLISALSASLTTTDQTISSSVATLSGSASTSRNLLISNISGSSTLPISNLSASLTTTDQIISSSIAALSGSASDARNLLGGGGASDYTSVYVTVDTTATSDKLYVFTSATTVTLTLPLSPSNGDSLYVSNRSGIDTNVVARNGELIMGLAQDVTLDVSQASFKLTYAAGSQGWVITGAGGSGVDTLASASIAILSSSFLALSSSTAPLSGSASDARNVLVASISGSSAYSSSYMTNNQNAENKTVYVFSDTVTFRTLTLPASPIIGDSVKVSNRSGLTTNIVARNGQNIMGTAADLDLDTAAAAFEIVFVGGTQGWVIIGAGS